MRIAQVSPLYERVPPLLYGGTERIVSYLTEELVKQGHEVTLFASGDSITSARLVPACKQAVRLDADCIDQQAYHTLLLELVQKEINNFDIVHYHIDYQHYPLSRCNQVCQLTTLHGRLDIPDLVPLYKEYSEMPVVSISDAQRKPLPNNNWLGTIYHGLPLDCLDFYPVAHGSYLAFVGRISSEKRADRAIEIAIAAGIPLKIAAKIDKADVEYYETVIKPMLNHPLIEYVGEVNEQGKNELMGNALALLFPIDWPEPFGLVMIEAMACGTPVIAYGHGSVPEVIDHGQTGFVVNNQADAIQAVGQVAALDRKTVRQVFEDRFSASRMATDYLRVYQNVIDGHRSRVPHSIAV